MKKKSIDKNYRVVLKSLLFHCQFKALIIEADKRSKIKFTVLFWFSYSFRKTDTYNLKDKTHETDMTSFNIQTNLKASDKEDGYLESLSINFSIKDNFRIQK